MELNKEYTMICGDIIKFDSISMYQNQNKMPMDIYTSKSYNGAWDKSGRYLTNIYFLDNKPSEMDIILNDK